MNITAANMLYANGVPDVVGEFDFGSVGTVWPNGSASGNIIFQNPKPGTQGNFGLNRIDGPGEWTLDMAMSKGVRITEGTNFQIRLDANNILNHPVPSYQSFGSGMRIIVAQPPIVDINSANPFGYLDNKVGTLTFQLTGRINF